MANEKGNPNHASNGQFTSGGGSSSGKSSESKSRLEKAELKDRPGKFVVKNNNAGGRAMHHIPVSSEEADRMVGSGNENKTTSWLTAKEEKEQGKKSDVRQAAKQPEKKVYSFNNPPPVHMPVSNDPNNKSGKDELPEYTGRSLDANPVGDNYPTEPSVDCGSSVVWPGRTLD